MHFNDSKHLCSHDPYQGMEVSNTPDFFMFLSS